MPVVRAVSIITVLSDIKFVYCIDEFFTNANFADYLVSKASTAPHAPCVS